MAGAVSRALSRHLRRDGEKEGGGEVGNLNSGSGHLGSCLSTEERVDGAMSGAGVAASVPLGEPLGMMTVSPS
jgi:hypothetical protein